MPFDRWRIDGYLTTKTPLHIGSGSTTTHPDLKDGDTLIEISAVETDCNGKAYIPGTTIKGNLRSWCERNGVARDIVEQLFGSRDTDKAEAVGGKAEFWNAYALTSQDVGYSAAYWRPDRLTDVTVSVSIDRHTRTAVEQKLFHQEFVPPGIAFELSISVQDATDDDISTLLYALQQGFSGNDPIAMGASTGNGWGRFEWSLKGISRMDSEGVKKWLREGATAVGLNALVPLPDEESAKLIEEASSKSIPVSGSRLEIGMRLKFRGLFLVNDPSRVKRDETPDHMPRLNHEGKVVLPAESFRGALRSQAERIIRTIGGQACGPFEPCNAISRIEELLKLCPACQVFGGTGWKSGISFQDFVMSNNKEPIIQEFVAIDRFTGGGAEHLKFNAEAVPDPHLEGRISIDMDKINPCGLGMLALAFRDLIEGDITLGFGASKGYGACTAEITDISMPSVLSHEWLCFIDRIGIDIETLQGSDDSTVLNDGRKVFLNACVEEFRETMPKIQEEMPNV